MSASTAARSAPWLIALATAIAGVALMLVAATPSSAQVGPPPNNFRTLTLSGSEEVPPVSTTAEGTFSWRVTDAGIETELVLIGTDFTMGHFHLGAKGVNGPVVAFLLDPIEGGQDAVHVTKLVTSASLVGPLAGKTLDDLAKEMAAGNIYVNVHSVENPAGVMRAQMPTDGIPPKTSTPGTGGGTPAATPRPPATGSGNALGDTFGSIELGLVLVAVALGAATIAVARRRS